VRTSGMARTPDVRFRPEFTTWSARFVVQYSELMSNETVIDLVDRAGSVGVGEWRPEKNGSFGTFEVKRHFGGKEIDEVRTLCSPILEPLVIPAWAMDAELTPDLIARLASPDQSNGAEDEEEVGT
jgi:hypothetical protein